MDKIVLAIVATMTAFALLIVVAFVSAVITQCAWNHSVTSIFHLASLTFWQAFWLNILCGFLFKSSAATKS